MYIKNKNYSNDLRRQSIYQHSNDFQKSQKREVPDYLRNMYGSRKTEKIFETFLSVWLAMGLFGLLTFLTSYTLQGIAFDKQMGFYFWILVVLIAWIIISVVRGEIKLRRTPLDIPIMIFWFIYFLSTVFSVDKWHSFWGFFGDPTHGLVNVTACIVSYYLILSDFNIRRLRFSLGAVIFSGLIIEIREILIVRGILDLSNQEFIQEHHWATYVSNSPIGSLSGTSIFLCVLIIFLIIAFLETKASYIAKPKKIILLSIFSLMIILDLYLLLAFYFFVSWSGILIGLGFFLIYIFARIVWPEKGLIGLPIFVFGAVLIILFVGSFITPSKKIVVSQLPVEISIDYKMSWQIAKEALMKHNFFLGSGPATYGYDFSLYRPQYFNLNSFYNLRFYQGSGIFWEALPTLGILGTLAGALLVISFLSVGIYFLSREKKNNKIYSLGFMSAALVILTDSLLVRIDGAITIFCVFVAIITLGAIFYESNLSEEYFRFSIKTSPKHALVSAFLLLVIGTSIVFLSVSWIRIYAADMFAYVSSRQGKANEEKSLNLILKAVNLNDKEGRYHILAGQQYMALANSEFLKGKNADLDLIEKYLDSATTLASQGRNLVPNDVASVEALAQIYENRSVYFVQFFDQAVSAYKDALALEPHNPIYFLRIGKIRNMQASLEKDETAKKNLIKESRDWFQKSVDQKENLAEAQYQLGSIQKMLGENDSAIVSFQKAINIDGTNVSYYLALANTYQIRGSKADRDYDTAEAIYREIISAQDGSVETHFSLGFLYEKMKRFSDAAAQYKRVSDLLGNENKDVKSQIQKMIDNANNGIENTAENLKNAPMENVESQNPLKNVPQSM